MRDQFRREDDAGDEPDQPDREQGHVEEALVVVLHLGRARAVERRGRGAVREQKDAVDERAEDGGPGRKEDHGQPLDRDREDEGHDRAEPPLRRANDRQRQHDDDHGSRDERRSRRDLVHAQVLTQDGGHQADRSAGEDVPAEIDPADLPQTADWPAATPSRRPRSGT